MLYPEILQYMTYSPPNGIMSSLMYHLTYEGLPIWEIRASVLKGVIKHIQSRKESQ